MQDAGIHNILPWKCVCSLTALRFSFLIGCYLMFPMEWCICSKLRRNSALRNFRSCKNSWLIKSRRHSQVRTQHRQSSMSSQYGFGFAISDSDPDTQDFMNFSIILNFKDHGPRTDHGVRSLTCSNSELPRAFIPKLKLAFISSKY
jgi:hypothetical protein